MPKVTILPQQRLYEFPESGFQVYDNRLWCPFCNEFLDHMKKCVIKSHAVSRKHAKGKSDYQQAFGVLPPAIQVPMICNYDGGEDLAARKRQQAAQKKKKKEKTSTIKAEDQSQRGGGGGGGGALLPANVSQPPETCVDVKIPIAIYEDQRFRFWLKDNLEYELPKKPMYEDGVSVMDLRNTATECLDRDVCIVLDDTMDTGESGLIAVNVFVSPLGESFKLKLVGTQFFETYDLDAVLRLTVTGLEAARIDGKNVVVMVSSNSDYLVQVGDRLKQFCPRLHCFPCWETILSIVINEVRSQCTVLDQFLFAVDTALKANPNQRQTLVVDLQQRQQSKDERGPLIPYLVSSKRPFAWLRVVLYLCRHFEWLKGWISTMPATGLNAIRLKDLVCHEQTKELLNRFGNISFGLSKVIDKFEKGTVTPSCIWNTMCEVANLLNKEGFVISELKIRLESSMPSSGFWKVVEILDPHMVKCPNGHLTNYLKELYFFGTEPVPMDEIQRYEKTLNLVSIHGAKTMSTIEFWKTCCDQLPTMSRLALKVLSIPLSTSFIEKTFAMSKTWNFSSNKRESLALDMRLFFNSKQSMNANFKME